MSLPPTDGRCLQYTVGSLSWSVHPGRCSSPPSSAALPLGKAWDRTIPENCLLPNILAYVSGALNVSTDIYILVLPMPCVLSLHATRKRKARVFAVLGIGIWYGALRSQFSMC